MVRWLEGLDRPIKRLAFAGVLVQPAQDRRSAYERLNQYLQWVEIDPDSSDFLYRINRPRQSRSGVAGLTINRLATWGAMTFTRHRQIMLAGSPYTQQQTRSESHACMLEFDVNTSGERQDPLPREQLGSVFGELVDLTLGIAREGDPRP
jgi:hypothetical protein